LPSQTETMEFLKKIGFTSAQARLYLALLETGKTTATALHKQTGIPRPIIYRTLAELQKKGLAAKEVVQPSRFSPTPIHSAMQSLVLQRKEELGRLTHETAEFLKSLPEKKEQTAAAEDYKLMMIDGKGRIIKQIKTQIAQSESSIRILTTLERWQPIVYACYKSYEKALDRGVKIRVLAQKADCEVSRRVEQLLQYSSSLSLKLSSAYNCCNFGIFDDQATIINYFPSKIIEESPVIWTNHPSFLEMCKDRFEAVWKAARKYESEKTEL
jgi:sugar-specific transcriptional regulator TrmB